MPSPKASILISGANGGLGSALVKQIVLSPEYSSKYAGLFLVRDSQADSTLKNVLRQAPADFRHDTMPIDQAVLSSVRNGAKAINARVAEGSMPPIGVLILNAGFQEYATQTFTEDGYDSAFQVNYLSHFLLTLSLLESMDKENGRIIVIGSFLHDVEDPRTRGDIFGDKYKTMFHTTESLAKGTWSSVAEDSSLYSGLRRYGASRLCLVMLLHEMQKRLDKDPNLSNIAVLGVDPGALGGQLARRGNFAIRVLTSKIYPTLAPLSEMLWPDGALQTKETAARNVLHAAFDKTTPKEKLKGAYFNGKQPWPTSKESHDAKKRKLLWDDSLEYAGIVEGDTVLKAWR